MPYISTSAICRIEWHESLLSIWFRPAGHCEYRGVPREVYLAFLAAPSRGTFYNDHIRDRY